jgi:hypothetical protein
MATSMKGMQALFFLVKTLALKNRTIRGNGQETTRITLQKVTGDWDVKFMRILADKIETPFTIRLTACHVFSATKPS